MLILILGCNPPIEKQDEKMVDSAENVDNFLSEETNEASAEEPASEPSIESQPENIDNDGDGYTENQGDCDDTDSMSYPNATEIAGDGIDQDCDGVDLTQIIRFVALGDAGEGNDAQHAVGDAIKEICDGKEDELAGCFFAIYLGDNFYDSGVDGVNDPQFQTKFEDPYSDITFPFYIALGNHDYGGSCLGYDCGGLGNEFDRSAAQIAYTEISDKWILPDVYYSFVQQHVQFFALDTTALMWDGWWWDDMPQGQEAWLQMETHNSDAIWKIGFGHHPYISNGRHGNAGSYEGLDWGFDALSGGYVKEFMDDYVCGKIDVYFSGHDHNRQWLEPTCGTDFIVSGAGAKTTDFENRGNPTFFEDDQKEGFIWVEIRDNCFYGEFYDFEGNLDFSHQICK